MFIINPVLYPGYTGIGTEKERSSKKIIITGTVTGLDKKPVEHAIIFIDTVFTRFETDESGRYTVKAEESAKTILAVIQDKGFGHAEIDPNQATDITITENATKMPDYVKRALKANQKIIARAQKLNTYTNIYEMIRQEVPGVTVSGTTITVKQGHSFFGSSTPLFVVNGVKVQSIDNIFPTQVKRIELLTGSQASMYSGVDATTGVIKITLISGGDK